MVFAVVGATSARVTASRNVVIRVLRQGSGGALRWRSNLAFAEPDPGSIVAKGYRFRDVENASNQGLARFCDLFGKEPAVHGTFEAGAEIVEGGLGSWRAAEAGSAVELAEIGASVLLAGD